MEGQNPLHEQSPQRSARPGCICPLFNDWFDEQLLTPHVIDQNCSAEK
jgi:hypothetical protein